MPRFHNLFLFALLAAAAFPASAQQRSYTWQQVRDKFETANPTLLADKLNIDEAKAQEITAYLRPNPNLSLAADQIDPFNGGPPHSCCGLLLTTAAATYLHERQHKRELRQESAKKATGIAISTHADLDRTLLFALRSAFVSTLQAKAVLQLAKDNLAYYDKVLEVSRTVSAPATSRASTSTVWSFSACSMNPTLQNAEVNLRTAKIQLLTLLNDRTPIEQFDVVRPVRVQ